MILEEIEIIHRTEEIDENKQKLLKASEQLGKYVTMVKQEKGAMKKKQSENKKELFKMKNVCQN